MSNTNLEQLQKLGRIFNSDKIVSTDDIKEVLDGVMQIMNSFKKENITLNKETKEFLDKVKNFAEAKLKEIKDECQDGKSELKELSKKSKEEIESLCKEASKEYKRLMAKMAKEKPKDGKTPLKGKDYFDGKDGKDGSPDTAEQIRNKLENLKGAERLSTSAIEGLDDIIVNLSKLMSETSGKGKATGWSKLIRFIDDETPIGTVNGSNAIFKIIKTPQTGSLKVYRNGSRMRVTEDYTFDGYRTITFIVPPEVGEVLFVDYRY